jgi:hypothetical protein
MLAQPRAACCLGLAQAPDRAHFVPVKRTSSTLDLSNRSQAEKKAILAAWVAELNVVQGAERHEALDGWLTQLLDEFDAQQKGEIEHDDLRRRFDAWLETAGETGGPEQEQDPTRPHAAAWHGSRREPED